MHRRHGTTYFWATQVLPRDKRPHVDALYGFCRYADEIVDDNRLSSTEGRAAWLDWVTSSTPPGSGARPLTRCWLRW